MSRILIVENDSLVRAALTSQLESSGYTCMPTETAAALTEARRIKPASAIVGVDDPSDGHMWIVRGFLTQPTPIPVIVMSSKRNTDVATAAARLGVSDCLVWPASPATVREALERTARWRSDLESSTHRIARLRQDVASGRAELIEALHKASPDAAPSVLTAILESRAPELFDHSRRVARSAASLAQAVAASPDDVRDIRLAALLHDIGKVALPERLLSGAGAVSDEEVAIVRRHAEAGAAALDTVPGHARVATLIRRAQDSYDTATHTAGGGTEVPLGARIIAIADAYDAMTSCRAYRRPLTQDEANAELVRLAGREFDPELVEAWLQMTELPRCS